MITTSDFHQRFYANNSSLEIKHFQSALENPRTTEACKLQLTLSSFPLPFRRVFDRDGNGYITRDELKSAMDMIGENVTEYQLNEMLELADADKDGRINYEGKKVCP